MKFLLDVGISPQLGRMLESVGHSYRYLPDHYSKQSADAQILNFARENDEVIITHDTDFGTILAFSAAAQPSVILFRIHHISAALFFKLIVDCWAEIELPLTQGALVVVEIGSIRIRRLPIN